MSEHRATIEWKTTAETFTYATYNRDRVWHRRRCRYPSLLPGRCRTSITTDSDNLNWQVSGKKLFLLAPPSVFADVCAYGSAQSPLNPFSPDLARFPRFAAAPAREALLEPGDVLLIPKYWWHCVYTLQPSVNLNTWFECPETFSAWRAREGVPLLHRTCSTARSPSFR